MDNKRPRKISGKLKWGLLGLAVVLFLYTIVGFFLLPSLMKHLLLKNLTQITQREVSVHGVRTNPFKFTVTLEGFSITSKDSQEELASFREIFINIESPSVIKWAFIVDEIRIVEPSLMLVRDKENRFNVSDILNQWAPNGEKAGGLPMPRLSINRLQIVNGRLEFVDELEHKRHLVEEIQLDIPLISNLGETGEGWVEPRLSAKVNGAPFTMGGKVSPFSESKRALLVLDMKEMAASSYNTYLPDEWDLKVLSGIISFQSKLAFSRKGKDKLAFNLSGALNLKDLDVTDRADKELLKLANLKVNVAAFDPVLKRLHVSEVSVGPFEVHVKRDASGKINLGSLVTGHGPGDKKNKKTEGASPFRFQVDEINLSQGKAYFTDRTMGEPFSNHLKIATLRLQGLRSDMDKGATLRLSGQTEFGEEVAVEGRFFIDPLSSEGKFEIKNIPAERYGPYYRQHISFDMGSPRISAGAEYRFAGTDPDPNIQLSNAWTSIHGLRFKPRDGSPEIAEIPVLDISGVRFDLQKRAVTVRELNATGGRLLIERNGQGKVNLRRLFPPKAVTPGDIAEEKGQTHGGGWSLLVEKATWDDFSLKAEDRSPSEPLSMELHKMNLELQKFSNLEESRARLRLSGMIMEEGSIKAEGSLGINPLAADLKLDMKNLSLPLAQPYLPSGVKVKITRGQLSTWGDFLLKERETREGWQLDFKGDAALAGFSAIDTIEEKELVSAKTLRFTDIHLANNPGRLLIKRANMDNFRMLTEIGPDGVFNIFRAIFEEKSGKPATPAVPGTEDNAGDPGRGSSPFKVAIDEMILQDGGIHFFDKLIKPNFDAKLLDIRGRIDHLSSEEGVLARIDLQGNVGGSAPVKLAGESNPLGRNAYVDMHFLFENFDITRMNPYARKYLGYNLEKGKLNLDLEYKIDRDRIASQSKILLERFTLGERVESPSAVKVDLEAAIPLLQDREGNIALNIPVSGRLSDPKFDLSTVYSKAFQSLMTGIVTAPFSFIGKVFGSGRGEELGYLEFDYGSGIISGDSAKKLDTLINALYERPKLDLEISGYADPEKDGNALKESLFLSSLKKEKMKDLAKAGSESVSPESVTLEGKEYEEYLRRAYLSAFSKDFERKGGDGIVSIGEMEKELRAVAIATEDDLALLAQRRAVEVRNYIIGTEKVNSKRIFLVKPKSLSPSKVPGVKDSRVLIKIQLKK